MPPQPDNTGPLPTLSAEFLLGLATLTGAGFTPERARAAIRNAARPGAKPMELFTNAARELFMHADPEYMSLKDAVWRSRRDTPVVLWSAPLSRWIVVTYAGWFRVRIADSIDHTVRRTVSREELAVMLGVPSLSENVEVVVIDPEYHAKHIRREGDKPDEDHGLTPAQRFFGFLRCERQDLTTFVIYSIFAAILYLGAPLAVDAVVSGLAFGSHEQPYIQAIVVVALALGACLVLHGLVNAFLYYISEVIQRRIFVRTAADLAHRLPRMDTASLDDVHAPEMVNRFMDIATLQKCVSILLLEGVNLVFSATFGMILLALYHPYLLLFVVVLAISITLVLRVLGTGGTRTSIKESYMKYDLVNCFEEIAHFPLLFKGPGGKDFAQQRANALVTGYVAARAEHFRILMRQMIGLLAIQVFAGAGILIVGGYLVLHREITLGQLVASELIMSAIVGSIGKLGKKMEAWYDAMAAADKVGLIVDIPVERSDGERPVKSGDANKGIPLVVKDMSFGHHSGHTLFDKLNFTVAAGERIAVVGSHGSGSSTLFDLLFALRTPVSGYITADGVDLRGWSLSAYRDDAQLIRGNEIVAGTMVENLRLGRTDIGADEIRDALEKVGLLETLRMRPEGVHMKLNLGGSPLSGSQRTRLLLARALVQRPRLLLLDDLLDALDKKSVHEVLPVIFDKKLPWTIVVATRDPAIAALCDRTVALAPAPASADA
jgi:putative ABC transport system ATP-binding protein